MIHGLFGKLGAGKGLAVMDIIARELVDGFRDVVTNVPIRILPWVNGQGLPQIGLRAYLLEKLFPLSEEEVDEILKRVRVEEDIEQGHDLFLWRRDGDTGEWFKLDVTKRDDKGRPERFDASQIKTRHCAPVLCVTDEAWQFYPNNGGWARAPILSFYGRQQRKLRDEWFIVTQHPTDCDEVFWKIAQDFYVCRNHGMERMGIFRQPSMFRIIVYLTNPAKGGAIRSHEVYRTLDKKLCQCYDTTAGVGIGGGFQGDSNQKRRGLHWAWLLVGICILVGLLASIPFGLKRFTTPFLTRSLSGRTVSSMTNSSPTTTQSQKPVENIAQNEPEKSQLVAPTNEVYCTGYAISPVSLPQVTLSDGTVAEPPELELISKSFVVVSGHRYKMRLASATTDYVPEPVPVYEIPPAPPRPVNQADVVVIGQRRQSAPPVSSGSFQRMAK